jgi:hypothetical protein
VRSVLDFGQPEDVTPALRQRGERRRHQIGLGPPFQFVLVGRAALGDLAGIDGKQPLGTGCSIAAASPDARQQVGPERFVGAAAVAEDREHLGEGL